MRYASERPSRKGFFGEFVENLRQEFGKDKEMKENIKKFREEAKRLEESDALQQARRKFVSSNLVLECNVPLSPWSLTLVVQTCFSPVLTFN